MARPRTPDEPAWVSEDGSSPRKACEICGDTFEFWTSLTPGADGQRRCATCHVKWLRGLVSLPDDRCPEPLCGKRVREHMAEFRESGKRIMDRVAPREEYRL